MSIQIDVEEEVLETFNKKDGSGTYSKQSAYAHVVDRSGQPERYPRKISMFPPRDNAGNPVPYKKGSYKMGPGSYRVTNNGQLEIGFIELVPIK